jgi:serine/threonine protein kinase
MRAEDPDSAANAYDQEVDKVKAANLRGEVALKQERIPDAARYFQEGEDYLRAAELFESKGMLAEAAGAYEAGESYAAAGSVYIRAGLKEKAAASYERAGDLETAAKLYEEAGIAAKAIDLYSKAGLTYKSGEAAANAGERDKAIALLQRVAASDENYRAATELLAKLFIEARMPGLAVERLQKALAGQAVSPATLDLYYWLAMGYEASGNRGEALGVYKKILSEDLQYRDVAQRVTRLEAPAAPAAAATPADRAPAAAQGLRARGVATLQICPTCGRCYDHTIQACAEDRTRLATPRVVPFVLVDRYQLVRVLGEGGMGLVFEARDQKLDRKVAIKIVNAEEFRDPAMKKRLEREARAVARVQHPGVIGLYDSGELEDGSAFLVMELLEGCDLASLMRLHGKGKPAQVASLLRQAGAAVAAAHNVGVVHRDIKPQNIFLVNAPSGFQVKVLDFGVAKSTNVETGVTRTGMIIGTPGYMAPEQIQGPGIDARTDLYSLAVVGFEALTGQRIIPEGPVVKMLFAVTNSVPSRLSSLVPGIPPAVDEAFVKGLAKNPASRPPDIARWLTSFVDQLERVPSQAGGWPEPVPTSVAKTKPLTLRGMTSEPSASPSAPTAAGPASASPRAPASRPAGQPAAAGPAGAPAVATAKPPRFVPKEELGRGPLGGVFRAEDQVDGRNVALRFLAPELLAKEGALQALAPDLKAAAQLSHPNVVKVLGLVEVNGQRCVVTEFVQGRNFGEALKAGHKMTFQQVHGLGRVLAQALSFIHDKSLVHGSIQPSNIMVASGVVKVADLGLGRMARTVQRNTNYYAPERQMDVTGDLFAMAAVLYHLLTGVHPKSQPQGAALPLPSKLAAGVPEAFDKLLLRCLHPRVDLRFATAADVLRELKDMVHIG